MRVLMLAPRMTMGHGVSEAVAMQVRGLEALGVSCLVGCLEYDETYGDVACRRVGHDPGVLADLAAGFGANAVVAHGSPYFEALPLLTPHVRTVAYEYGDPTPAFFAADGDVRTRIAAAKRAEVYPRVSAVAAISEFVRHDIDWPAAHVIRLGVEHVSDEGSKPLLPQPDPRSPLRVTALMRLGSGEASYKGHDDLLRLAAELAGGGVRMTLAGRGTPADAHRFAAAGFEVLLNIDDPTRARLLRDADVFVTTSRWEGMNLPLVEAQALGTPGLAPDTGAHPEFTPLVFDSVPAMARQVRAYRDDRALLAEHGRMSRSFVRSRLRWDETVLRLAELLQGASRGDLRPRGPLRRQAARAQRLRAALTESGVRATWTYHADRRRRSGP